MINRTKQVWQVGETVKVGFMTLRVLQHIPTPCDYLPDAYALTNADASRYYRFTPHNGCARFPSLAAAIKGE